MSLIWFLKPDVGVYFSVYVCQFFEFGLNGRKLAGAEVGLGSNTMKIILLKVSLQKLCEK